MQKLWEEVKMKLKIDLGENRHVRLLIHSKKQEDFVIDTASYVLEKNGIIEAEGACMIIDHIIDTVINPEEAGIYVLRIKYMIADETLIDVIEVMVM